VTVSAQQTLQATRRLTQTEAIVEAMAEEMRRDPSVFYIGQDVGEFGGSMQGSQGLWTEFGPKRIREAPISESAMVGAAIGAALFGRRPIVEVSFGEFLPAAMNQLINQAPNLHYMTGGAAKVPDDSQRRNIKPMVRIKKRLQLGASRSLEPQKSTTLKRNSVPTIRRRRYAGTCAACQATHVYPASVTRP